MGLLNNARKDAGSVGYLTRTHDAFMKKANEADDSHSDGKLHPSSISGCPTAAVIGILLLEAAVFDARILRIFDLGTSIHERLQAQYLAAGLIATLNNGEPAIEVPIKLPEYDMVGAADGIVHISATTDDVAVLEAKSINSNAFTKLTEPKPEHKIQATCYVMGLEKELNGSRKVVFIYYSKNDSKIKEFHYEVRDHDIDIVKQRIATVQEMIKEYKANPCAPKPYYEKPNSTACRYCSYSRNCHDTFYRVEWDRKLRGEIDANATQEKPKATGEVQLSKKKPKAKGLGKRKVEKKSGAVGRSLKRK